MTDQTLRAEPAPRCLLCGLERPVLYTGLRDRHYSAPGDWNMRHCGTCGLLWLDPRPHPEVFDALYRGYYTHVPAAPVSTPRRNLLVDEFGLAEMPPGRLLELSCGNGDALEAMANLGWEVVGVEPDREAAARAAARGLRVLDTTLERARFPESYFDVVVVRNAFGYIPTPIESLSECRRIMREGGRLAMSLPNLSSAGHRWFGENWVMLDPPREHFVFSGEALRACIQRAGLSLQSIRATARWSASIWLLSSAIRRHGRLAGYGVPRADSLIQLPAALLFQALESARSFVSEAGEELIVLATKPRSA